MEPKSVKRKNDENNNHCQRTPRLRKRPEELSENSPRSFGHLNLPKVSFKCNRYGKMSYLYQKYEGKACSYGEIWI